MYHVFGRYSVDATWRLHSPHETYELAQEAARNLVKSTYAHEAIICSIDGDFAAPGCSFSFDRNEITRRTRYQVPG